ncbi:MAG: hypothetical protein C4318_03110 [Acidimicrobiia bacterium]
MKPSIRTVKQTHPKYSLILLTTVMGAVAISGCSALRARGEAQYSERSKRGQTTPSPASQVVSETLSGTQTVSSGTSSGGSRPIPPAVTSSPFPEAEKLPAVEIEIKDGSIGIDRTALNIGTSYRFIIANRGTRAHSLELRTASYKTEQPTPVFTLEGDPLRPGETRVIIVSFTLPGPYQLVCPLEGHRDSGEIASLAVL